MAVLPLLLAFLAPLLASLALKPEQQAHAAAFLLEAEAVGAEAIREYNSSNPCRFWHDVWAKSRREVRFLDYVHVPKAGGHYVETWLKRAYHGDQNKHVPGDEARRTKFEHCGGKSDTSDCINFHGGHHSFGQRIVKEVDPTADERAFGMYFVTTAREPISRLISHYNDATGFLSVWRCTEGQPLYCGPQYRDWCKDGTGFNYIAAEARAKRRLPNATAPCEPRRTIVEYALQGADANSQSWYILPLSRRSWATNRTAAANAMRALLRRAYLQVGTASSAHSLAAFVDRLRYSLDTPWRPSTDRDTLVPTDPSVPQVAPSASERSLDASTRERIYERHWSDRIVYHVLLEIESEQQECYLKLPTRWREPLVQNTSAGLAVVHSAWWLPASQIDGLKRPLRLA